MGFLSGANVTTCLPVVEQRVPRSHPPSTIRRKNVPHSRSLSTLLQNLDCNSESEGVGQRWGMNHTLMGRSGQDSQVYWGFGVSST